MKPTIKPNDVHIVVSDFEDPEKFVGQAKCFDASGKLLWQIDALCKGINGPGWAVKHGDTPPGVYVMGSLTETAKWEGPETWNAYGRYFIDLVEMENQEAKVGRSGIGLHGGGTGAKPFPMAEIQELRPTLGCVRIRNKHMRELVVPTYRKVKAAGGTLWVSVNQF